MVSEGYKFGLPPLAAGMLLASAGWLAPLAAGARTAALAAGAVLAAVGCFVFYFFRDPERQPPEDPDAVVSPADGRVMEIVEEDFEGRPGRRVSIFLSIFDVHVNRAPCAGRIRRVEYRPGNFLVAARSRASAENEQNVIQIETPRGEMACKQIAGMIARRVLCWKSEGETVARGERIGMIRFGSRMDVWLPPEADIMTRRGEHVAAGSSVLALWRPHRADLGK